LISKFVTLCSFAHIYVVGWKLGNGLSDGFHYCIADVYALHC